MPRFNYILPLIFVSTILHSSDQQSQDYPEGWLWYKNPELVEEIEPLKKEESDQVSIPKDKPKTALERMENYKKRFEEAKAQAILEPTLENVAYAQKLHHEMIEQASTFQKVWSVAEMLDVSQKQIPVSPSGAKIDRKIQKDELDADLKTLAKSFGLIFAFMPNCPYCHKFAPLVVKFAKEHGFDLQGLSKDDNCFEGMNCSKNVAAMEAINPNSEYPILYLANPKTKDVIPVARGLVNGDQLRQNMRYAIRYLKNHQGDAS